MSINLPLLTYNCFGDADDIQQYYKKLRILYLNVKWWGKFKKFSVITITGSYPELQA